jgi:hypothetical protein
MAGRHRGGREQGQRGASRRKRRCGRSRRLFEPRLGRKQRRVRIGGVGGGQVGHCAGVRHRPGGEPTTVAALHGREVAAFANRRRPPHERRLVERPPALGECVGRSGAGEAAPVRHRRAPVRHRAIDVGVGRQTEMAKRVIERPRMELVDAAV